MCLTGRDPRMSVNGVDCCCGGCNEGKWQTGERGRKGVSGCLGDTVRYWNIIGSRFIELSFSFWSQKNAATYFILSIIRLFLFATWMCERLMGDKWPTLWLSYNNVTVIFERWFYFLLFFPYKRGSRRRGRHARMWAVQLQCIQRNGLVLTEACVFTHSEEPLE